jgi:hypothetical protein
LSTDVLRETQRYDYYRSTTAVLIVEYFKEDPNVRKLNITFFTVNSTCVKHLTKTILLLVVAREIHNRTPINERPCSPVLEVVRVDATSSIFQFKRLFNGGQLDFKKTVADGIECEPG